MLIICKQNIIVGLVIVCFVSSTAFAQAQVDYNRAVLNLATEIDNGYVRLSPVPSGTCNFNVIYFPLGTPQGKAKLSLLLTAKGLQKGLSVVSYVKDTAGNCWGQTFELEP